MEEAGGLDTGEGVFDRPQAAGAVDDDVPLFAVSVVGRGVSKLHATFFRDGEAIPFGYFADADGPRVQKDLADHSTHGEPYGDPDDIPGNAPAR